MKTLLDEFAMAALTGLLSNSGLEQGSFENYAHDAYAQAEAMMEERKKHVKEDDGWIAWEGGECPVDPTYYVDIKLRSGTRVKDEAFLLHWHHNQMATSLHTE